MLRSIDVQVIAGCGLVPDTVLLLYFTVRNVPAGTVTSSPTASTAPSDPIVVTMLLVWPTIDFETIVSVVAGTVHVSPVHQPAAGPAMNAGTKSMSTSMTVLPRSGTGVVDFV